MSVVATFYNERKTIIKTVQVVNGVVLIPKEIVQYPYFYIYLTGTYGNIKVTTNDVSVAVVKQTDTNNIIYPDWYNELLNLLDLKQNIKEDTLLTLNKTIPTAINKLFKEINKKDFSRIIGGSPLINDYKYIIDGGTPLSAYFIKINGGVLQ